MSKYVQKIQYIFSDFHKKRRLSKSVRHPDAHKHLDPKKAPKIIITGGLGFIFSHVTEHFVKKGWRVVVIDNMTEGSFPEIVDGSFVHYNLHMSDVEVMEVMIHEKPDYIVHGAAISDVDYSIKEPYKIIRKNTLGTLHAFEAARKLEHLKKILYISTDEVYGECEVKKVEGDPMEPRNPYSCSKGNGSLMRIAYENTYPSLANKTVETRFCNVFGPRQDPRKILSILKKATLEDISIPIHNEGTGYREYIYIRNIPAAIDLILDKGHGIYNVTLNDGFRVKDLVDTVQKITGKKIKTHAAHRPGMDMKYQMDASRLRALGWKPLYTFEQGIKEYFTNEKKEQKEKSKGK